jgi:hypothetical protein
MESKEPYYGGLLGPKLNNTFKLDPAFVDKYRHFDPPFGFNGLGEIVYLRTYAREKEDGTCEEWVDTVERVVNGVFEILQLHIVNKLHTSWLPDDKANKLSQDMFDRIFNMKFLPPGRSLWAMGSPIIRKKGFAASLNNCAFVSTSNLENNRVEPFIFLMDASMLGVGVGFDTNGAGSFIIPGPNNASFDYVIPDDREGWVESVKLLLLAYLENKSKPIFDYSKIRLIGQKLRTFGGTSSGPGPLVTLHKNIKKCLDKEVNSPISVTCITDIMNMIGVCTVSGNIRRCIPRDSLVHTIKGLVKIQNIAVGDLVQTSTGYERVTEFYSQGLQHVLTIDTINGQFKCTSNHLVAIQSTDFSPPEWIQAGKLQHGDRMITSRSPINGSTTYIDIITEFIERIELTPDLSWFIGIVTSTYYAGMSLTNSYLIDYYKGTSLYTSYYIDNMIHNILINQFTLANEGDYSMYAYDIPDYIKQGRLSTRMCYLIGLIDVINGIDYYSKAARLTIAKSACKEWIQQVQAVCYSCGFETYIDRSDVKYELHAYTKYGIEFIKEVKNLVNSKGHNYLTSNDVLLMSETLLAKLNIIIKKYYTTTVISVNYLESSTRSESKSESKSDKYETYDIAVENKHEFYCNGYLVHNSAEIAFGQADCKEFLDLKSYEMNPHRQEFGWASNNSIFAKLGMDYSEACKRIANNGEPGFAWLDNMQSFSRMNGQPDNSDFRVSGGNPCLEQSLESMELCNLVECFPTKHSELSEFINTLKSAFLFAKVITLLPVHWNKTNEIMMRNRRIGCSVSGIAQFINDRGLHTLKEWLEIGYDFLKQTDKEISEWLCIRQSIKITSVKPSGTVSLLAGVTPGIHYPESNYYIRRMRIARDSSLIHRLVRAGYHIEPCVMSPETTLIVEFPVVMGDNIRTLEDISMWEQLSLASFMQKYWADNQVSCTVTFNKKEADQIEMALNYFQYQLKGISFLPRLEAGSTIYKQVPYESITEEQYNMIANKLDKSIKLSKDAVSTATDGDHMTYCDNDRCYKL